jgi:hypothetical protein
MLDAGYARRAVPSARWIEPRAWGGKRMRVGRMMKSGTVHPIPEDRKNVSHPGGTEKGTEDFEQFLRSLFPPGENAFYRPALT